MSELLSSNYDWLRAFHIFSVIAWMAGLLYLPRLFAYHSAAQSGGELDEALKMQERRLLKIIMNPAVIAVWVFGLLMLWANPALLSQPWMHIKLTLLVILTGLHQYLAIARKAFERGERPRSNRFWRIVNEVPAVLALIIVILAVVEPLRS